VIERDASFSRARDELAKYPEFLGRKHLFFGLLTTKKTVNDTGDITMKVCDSFFGINLLAFGKTSFQSGMRQRDGLSTVVLARIPIVGGMLVCQDISNHNSNIDDDLGEICFRLTHSKSNEPQRNDQIELESRVIDYKPAISGLPTVNILRRTLYMNTQRYVHAYVMKRFHDHCYESLFDC
jgi:hypothetical protein